MEAEGLKARSFHGAMSAGERATTIAAFRSGDAPIMISTDAGAEGQNLQFCNCVLNFDLPWNPMRIEQRIGRVDRLTQPKDEVFIANLYAQRTIDESVYRLLAEKLRMFELLFGQVTTILGELDDAKSATFEARVLEALFANTDSKMEGLLNQLGAELEQARKSASTLIAADSGLSSWMNSAFEHRKGLSKAGTTELAPEVSERSRRRQRRVQKWTRSVLQALDAELVHDTGAGEGAFLTAQFGEEFTDELGGRTLLHLAFDRLGLEQHPDAELCAVGSPVFDELLGLLRMRGDMHATVPVIPDDIGPTPFEHAPTMTLRGRRLVPSGSWSGQATFRSTIGEAETTEHLITAEVNGHNERRLPRRPLQDGETLPPAFDIPAKIIVDFEKAAARQLEALRGERVKQVEAVQAAEFKRIRKGYTAQIAEAAPDDRARLERALRSEEKRLSRRPDIRARAKLLAVVLDEDDWLVEECWSGPNGAEGTLTYEWDQSCREAPLVISDASSESISVLALCSDSHWVDASETAHCQSCDQYLCSACGDDALFKECPLCSLTCCNGCRRVSGGLCRNCAAAQRAPELDDESAIAWRINAGAVLLVGERVATLHRNGSQPINLVRDEDANDHYRAQMRSYAAANGLTLDAGLVLRDYTERSDVGDPSRTRLATAAAVSVEYAVIPAHSTSIEPAALNELPHHPEVRVSSEREFNANSFLRKLRTEVPPPPPPAVIVTRRSKFVDIYLEADRVVRETVTVADGGGMILNNRQEAHLVWREPSLDSDVLAEVVISDALVALQRRNDAVVVSTYVEGQIDSDPPAQWHSCPDARSLALQLACFDRLQSLGMPGGRLAKRADEALNITGHFPSPSECQLASRKIEPISVLAEPDSTTVLMPADVASLKKLGLSLDITAAQAFSPLLPSLGRALQKHAVRSFTAVVLNGFEVVERWRGHGTAVHSYRTFNGEPHPPVLSDSGTPSMDFGVCRDGHFYEVGTAAFCDACQTWACRACDGVEHLATMPCLSCSASVCRRCLSSEHTAPPSICVLCGDHACSDCGRDPSVVPCARCQRVMCAFCRRGDICGACDELRPATDNELANLPKDLVARGARALIGKDSDALVVLVNRGEVFEKAIVRNGSIDSWIAYGRNNIDASYRLRLAASALFGVQIAPIVTPLRPEQPIAESYLDIQSERSFRPGWSVEELEVSGCSPKSFKTPDGELCAILADEFPPLGQLPEPAHTVPQPVGAIFNGMRRPKIFPLVARWDRFGYSLAVTSAGIYSATFEGSSERQGLATWALPGSTFEWIADEWEPVPVVRAHAALGDTDAVIVTMASLAALGIRTIDHTEWYAIVASPDAPASTALSRSIALGDADQIGIFTDPAEIRISTVANAAKISLSVKPLGVLKTAPRATGDASAGALSAWGISDITRIPKLRALPNAFRAELQQLHVPVSDWTRLDIGAHIQQLATMISGQTWLYESKLAPGEVEGRRSDFGTGALLDSGFIDREGHFGLEITECSYCSDVTCALCVDKVVLCDCCAVPICKRCIREPYRNLWLCPACMSSRPPTRSEARDNGRILLTRRMLIGTDPRHTVVFERSNHHWARRAADGEKQIVANPSVADFLDAQLKTAKRSAERRGRGAAGC
ncbi:hypothetical protein Mkiyose1088_49200 [Mycobacterium kiyosense]|nr:hypothetical protein Mkiyose1088_49200 [Mycobacterium kiyosense]